MFHPHVEKAFTRQHYIPGLRVGAGTNRSVMSGFSSLTRGAKPGSELEGSAPHFRSLICGECESGPEKLCSRKSFRGILSTTFGVPGFRPPLEQPEANVAFIALLRRAPSPALRIFRQFKNGCERLQGQ